jgi:hypothetical protein
MGSCKCFSGVAPIIAALSDCATHLLSVERRDHHDVNALSVWMSEASLSAYFRKAPETLQHLTCWRPAAYRGMAVTVSRAYGK